MSDQTPWENDANQQQYGELDGYSAEYKPEHAFKHGVDTLPNGDHACTIVGAQMDKVKGDLIVRISLKTDNGGQVEWTSWLNKQGGVNGFCADLAALGFDCGKWGSRGGPPLSSAIPQAVSQLTGLRFKGRKSSREVDSKQPGGKPTTYHDFRVLSRIGGQAAPVNRMTPSHSAPAPAGYPAPGNDEGAIPF